MGTYLQKISGNQPLPDKTKKTKRNFPDEHSSTPLPGKTKPNPERKSKPMPNQTQETSENTPLLTKTQINLRGS